MDCSGARRTLALYTDGYSDRETRHVDPAKAGLTFDDWLAAERKATETRSECVAGEVFAMTGGSFEHSLIGLNIGGELRGLLKGKPCYVLSPDIKVRIEATDVGAYPDVTVICGEPTFYDGHRDTVTNPTLVVEVLSNSTEAYDRGDKFAHYRTLPSLQAYLLVCQDKVRAELYTRSPDGTWVLSSYEALGEQIRLESVDATLALVEIYDRVEL